MTKPTPITGHLLAAIDVAKKVHEVLIQWPDGKTKYMKVPNILEEFKRLHSFFLSQNLPVLAALEPTADFHRAIAHWLSSHGTTVHLASSLACARVREALFNSWDKHDRKDAKVILYLLSQGLTRPFHDPLAQGYMHLQEISNTFHQVSKARTRCLHSLLNHGLPIFFPEFEKFIRGNHSDWFCHFLIRFPTPTSILALSRQQFVMESWDLVGRKVAKERLLNEIYDTASQSVALPIKADNLSCKAFALQVQRHQDLSLHLKELENMAEKALHSKPDYHRLRSIPGIGPVIALTILAESGDLRRFTHHRQYLKYCGFDLCSRQSGQTQSRYSLSKRGNARLRYAFWLAATVAIRMRENSFRWKYERYIKRDSDNADLKRKGYTAIAVKMARVAHALIKRGENYRGYHEAGVSGGGT